MKGRNKKLEMHQKEKNEKNLGWGSKKLVILLLDKYSINTFP
jgi:hypothetical protein